MGRILGVDLGARRIGLAVSDPTGLIASPLRVVERSGDAAADRSVIVAAARAEEAATVVIGLPKEMSGRHGIAANAATAEVDALRGARTRPHLRARRRTTDHGDRASARSSRPA